MPPRLSIIIPVYNEHEVILDTLLEVDGKIHTPHQILVIYDFDEDTTVPVVSEHIKTQDCAHIQLTKNRYKRGVLNAIKTGFEAAESDAMLVVMGDASDDLAAVDPMMEKFDEGYDVICGSRYMPGGSQTGGPWLKKTLSRLAGLSLHYLTGIPCHDVSNSFKLYRRSMVSSFHIESRGGFEIGMEILVKAYLKGYRITEVPSHWRDRTAGKSNFKLWKWLPHYLRWYWLAIAGRKQKS